jgi:hypothetical protein
MMSNNFSTHSWDKFNDQLGRPNPNADCERSAIHAIAQRNYVPVGTFRVLRKLLEGGWQELRSFGHLNDAVHYINTQAPHEVEAMMVVQVLAFLPER